MSRHNEVEVLLRRDNEVLAAECQQLRELLHRPVRLTHYVAFWAGLIVGVMGEFILGFLRLDLGLRLGGLVMLAVDVAVVALACRAVLTWALPSLGAATPARVEQPPLAVMRHEVAPASPRSPPAVRPVLPAVAVSTVLAVAAIATLAGVVCAVYLGSVAASVEGKRRGEASRGSVEGKRRDEA